MIFGPEEIIDKKGESFIVRSLKRDDRDLLISFITQGARESLYFPWAPGETELTVDNAGEYILDFENDSRKLLLGAFRDGRLIGLEEFSGVGNWKSMRLRCLLGAGFLKENKGSGMGTRMLMTAVAALKEAGYEQLESNAATDNILSINFHRNMDFQEYGMIPHKKKRWQLCR